MMKFRVSEGREIPAAGLGMWKVETTDAASLVVDAVDAGWRHFDCACDYGNEEEVGQGLRQVMEEKRAARDDLWVTSKLWNTYHQADHVRPACERTLRDLGLDELDLYLVHFPIPLRYVPFEERYPPGWFHDPEAAEPRMEFEKAPLHETWAAMERLKRDGLVKEIGICNMTTGLIRDLLCYADIRPTVLQVEAHPYLTQDKLLRFCQEEDIVMTAFSPLGALSYVSIGMASADDSLIEESVIRQAAEAHGKTPAQVALRWGVQRGTSIVPKTSNRARLKENLDLESFTLSDEEMASISALNRNQRYNDPGVFGEAAFHRYCPIFD
ncbi:MAG: aldo/keto reductase [Verrucomicrobiota bacterium]